MWTRLRRLGMRVRATLSPDHDRALRDELRLHLDLLEDEYRAGGMTPDEARRAAAHAFGNPTLIQERSHDLFSFRPFEDLALDLRYAARTLVRQPSVLLAAVLSFGLAIGVNTTIYALLRDLLLAAPTARDPQRLAAVRLAGNSHTSLANLRDIAAAEVFDLVAGFNIEPTVNWRTRAQDGSVDEVRQVPVMLVSESYFDLLGTAAAKGHVFTASGARAEAAPRLVVITDRFWVHRLARDPAAVGRALHLNGRAYTIVGVLPEGFRPPSFLNIAPDLYLPISAELVPGLWARDAGDLMLIARLKNGQTRDDARAALEVVRERLLAGHTRSAEHFRQRSRVSAASGLEVYMTDPDNQALLAFGALLLAAVLVVLWIACVNIAGVLTARFTARGREMAVRLAIGAGRARLVRQLLTESLLLASLGGCAGWILQYVATRLVNRVSLPVPLPIVFRIEPDAALVTHTVILTLGAAIVAGLLPALQASRADITTGLSSEAPSYSAKRFRLRQTLLVSQVAITVTLLIVALLFVRSLARVQRLDPGLDLDRTVWARMTLVTDRYSQEQLRALAGAARDAASAVPGVSAAALATVVPFNTFLISAGQIAVDGAAEPIAVDYYGNTVGPAYFAATGIRLIAGRAFDDRDRPGAPRVIIINAALAHRLFGERAAVGRHVRLGRGDRASDREIVGIAGNSKHFTMGEPQAFAVYEPFAQAARASTTIHVLAGAASDASAVVASLRRGLSALDDTAAVDVAPLRSRLTLAYLPSQIGASLVGAIGVLGLVLAVIGLYGTMTYAVSRRTAEIGIRMALGASPSRVLATVLGRSFTLVAIGLVLGVPLSVAIARPLAFGIADGISPMDPLTIASAALVCLAATLTAALVPARRALATDPVASLRAQ